MGTTVGVACSRAHMAYGDRRGEAVIFVNGFSVWITLSLRHG